MFQGSWKCSSCGGEITELPFQPRSEAGLTCRACFMKQKGGGGSAPTSAPAASEMPPADMSETPPLEADVAGEPQLDDGLDAAPAPGEKSKFSGDWQCATCGASITSLPFQPRSTDNLKCLDCFKDSKR